MRRPIKSRLKIFWCDEDKEYVAIAGILPGLRSTGRTAEKALLKLSLDMQEFLQGVIERGDNI